MGCNGRQSAAARIFERKHKENNKLLIVYVYQVNGNAVVDSAIIDNKVLESDSVKVYYDDENPHSSTPELPE